MSDLLATITMPHVSNLPRDAVSNNLAFHTVGDFDQGDIDAINDVIKDFWLTPVGAFPIALGRFLGNGISRAANACTIKIYDITDKLGYVIDPVTGKKKLPNHGSPVNVDAFTLPVVGQDNTLPEECSIVVTLRAEGWEDAAVEAPDNGDIGTETNRPRQRFSGRFFVPPLNLGHLEMDNGKARPSSGTLNQLRDSMVRLANDVDDGTGIRHLCVWSRMDATLRTVTHVETDNAWDTQRRRGVQPSLRLRSATAAA